MKNITFARYIETFHILEKYSEEYGYQLEHLLKQAENLQDGFSLLDIGAGTGQFARSFLEKSKKKTSSYTAIEPSGEHIELINKNLALFPIDRKIIKESFTPITKFQDKFDLIIMSHCIYWFVPKIAENLENARKLLNKNGKLVIYLQTFATFSYILNVFLRGSEPIFPHRVSSREVAQILDKHKINYDIDYLPGALRADDILSSGNEGLLNELISFALFSEARDLSERDLRFAQDLIRLLAYKTEAGYKLNLSLAAITIKSS